MLKRGQVTVFIIVGIILLALVATTYFLFSKTLPQEQALPLETDKITGLVEDCLVSTAEKGIISLGRQGGYFILPSEATTTLRDNVPYYKTGESILLPPAETLAAEL